MGHLKRILVKIDGFNLSLNMYCFMPCPMAQIFLLIQLNNFVTPFQPKRVMCSRNNSAVRIREK